MSKINDKEVDLLVKQYEHFCNSVEYRSGEDFYVKDNPIIELSYNENPLGPGQKAKDVIKYFSEFAHLYPPIDYNLLINKLAESLGLTNGNIFISAGSVSAIYLAVFQNAERGDNVIYSKSSMPWYRWSIIGNNSIPVEVPLLPDMNHDLEGILNAIDNKTRVIILSNPHNPTGLYIEENVLFDFFRRVPGNILLLIDQAYYEYQSNREDILINQINNFPNLLLTRTFSKIHGLAGLRVGYAMSNVKTIKTLKAKWLGSMPTISSLAFFAALYALDDKDHVDKSFSFNKQMKSRIEALSEEFNLLYLKSEANFITLQIENSFSNEKYFIAEGIRFTPGYFYGYPEYARISFDKNASHFINRLSSALKHMLI